MSAAGDPLQVALYGRLSAVLAPIGVFDGVRQGQAYPYVTIGEDVATPGPLVDVESEEIVTTLHAWSDQGGFFEAKTMLAQIKAALHDRPLAVTGFRPVRLLYRHSTVFTQPDGVIRHGVIQFRALIERP